VGILRMAWACVLRTAPLASILRAPGPGSSLSGSYPATVYNAGSVHPDVSGRLKAAGWGQMAAEWRLGEAPVGQTPTLGYKRAHEVRQREGPWKPVGVLVSRHT